MAKKSQAENQAAPKASKCPISRDKFSEHAKPLLVQVAGKDIVLDVKRNKETGEIGFSTGSLGWGNNDKIVVLIDGVPVKCQVNFSLIVVGSKPE